MHSNVHMHKISLQLLILPHNFFIYIYNQLIKTITYLSVAEIESFFMWFTMTIAFAKLYSRFNSLVAYTSKEKTEDR